MGRLTHRTALGTSYFVTTKTFQNRALFLVTEIAELLVQTVLDYRQKGEYLLHEFVLMPDHLHVLLTPSPTDSLEKCMQFIKGGSAFRINRQRDAKLNLWHAGFHDWTIRDATDWRTRAEYIRFNPVKSGLVRRPEDWLYSSANGKIALDPMPAKYLEPASGAKAKDTPPHMSDLKVRPPKELKPPPPKEAR